VSRTTVVEQRTAAPEPDTRRTRTVPETAKILGVGLTTAWKMANNGEMRVVRFGRAVRVPVEEIERLLHDK
jgi:excisionase family DNA binding protein